MNAAPAPSKTPSQVVELVVNLDDVSAQVIGHAQQALLEAGALDVWTTPITMKKQRPGTMLSLLCTPAKAEQLARDVLTLTGSFGLRRRQWDRLVLQRHHESLVTRYGPVRIKVGALDGKLLVARPEYEDVRELARAANLPLRAVMAAADGAAQQWLSQQPGMQPAGQGGKP